MKENWIIDLKTRAKKFCLDFNKKIRFGRRLEEFSFCEGVSFAVSDIKTSDKFVWRKAKDLPSVIDSIKNHSILIRREDNLFYEYSVQQAKELTGFKMDVFLSTGHEWTTLDGMPDIWQSVANDNTSDAQSRNALMDGVLYSSFSNELLKQRFGTIKNKNEGHTKP